MRYTMAEPSTASGKRGVEDEICPAPQDERQVAAAALPSVIGEAGRGSGAHEPVAYLTR